MPNIQKRKQEPLYESISDLPYNRSRCQHADSGFSAFKRFFQTYPFFHEGRKNAISLNGEKAGGRTLLKNHDILNILVPETGSTEHIIPVPMELSVLYEDEDILAVDKPAGMPVHPSMGNYENTLANGSAFILKAKICFAPSAVSTALTGIPPELCSWPKIL